MTNLQRCRSGIDKLDKLDKLVMIMKNWLVDAKTNYPREGQSIDELLMEEASIIDENDTILNASGYFIVDHELEY